MTIEAKTYEILQQYLSNQPVFQIHKQEYMNDIRKACESLGIMADGSHGLRWNFAQRRMYEHALAGYSYEQSLQMVSWEMKHERASITQHYLV